MTPPTFSSKHIGKTAALLSLAVVLSACSSNDDDPVVDQDGTAFIFQLSPAEEVPPVVAEGAAGEANLRIDAESGAISGSVSVSGLTGQAQMAHVHRAFAGSNGPILFGLEGNDTGTVWTVPDEQSLDSDQLEGFTNGELYINVHTDVNGGGELRGQIVPTGVQITRSDLSGSQEVPTVATEATGTAVLTLNETSGAIIGAVFTTGVDDAEMAHIHQGAMGQNGAVLVQLEPNTEVTGSWVIPAGATLDAAGRTALEEGGLYYNVHTPAVSTGEIRGQIVPAGVDTGATQFTVRIDNLSTSETLPTSTGSVAVPLSPGAYVIHRAARNPLLDPRDVSSAALEALAEDGNPELFPGFVAGSGVFDTPVGDGAPGPLTPGKHYSFSFYATPGDKLALATMFVQSNDWFYSTTDGDDDSIELFDATGAPRSGVVASTEITLWESGTEQDEEPGTGPNQAPRQPAANTGPAEGETVGSLAGKGKSVTLNGDVIQVTITPAP